MNVTRRDDETVYDGWIRLEAGLLIVNIFDLVTSLMVMAGSLVEVGQMVDD
jgi:hypothetical protein